MNYDHPDTNASAAPCVMTICGAAGDLTKRKLIPALCNLAQEKLLPEQFAVVGFSADDFTTESFREHLVEEIPKFAASPIAPQLLDWMCERSYYVKGDSRACCTSGRLRRSAVRGVDKRPRFFSTIAK